MVARVHRKEKVRLVPVGPDSGAVDSESNRRISDVYGHVVLRRIADDIDQRFAGVRVGRGMLLLIGLHFEVHFIRAASIRQRRRRGILSDRWRCEEQSEQR